MTTFGFELEMESGADLMVAQLHSMQMLPEPRLHSYHCECSWCDINSGHDLRAQTDSSCSGEFITRPFEDMDEARQVMGILQSAAVDVDAEPGYDAGFHVHVDMSGRARSARPLLVWQFIEWEPVLSQIAAGRFNAMRDNNCTLAGIHSYGVAWANTVVAAGQNTAHIARRTRLDAPADNFQSIVEYAWERHRGADRHNNLNVRTRYETWEYRLWNSTRSAWRMELWCWLSMAFADPRLLPILSSATTDDEPSIDLLRQVLFDNRYAEAAVLLDRQRRYMDTRAIDSDGYVDEPAFTLAI